MSATPVDPSLPSPPPRAAGVKYFEAAPGFEVFRCQPYRTTLSPSACAKRHVAAQSVRPDDFIAMWSCRHCKVGMAHAGKAVIDRSEFYRNDRCSRCRRGTTRLIGGIWCPSCYNRSAEFRKGGLNSKGTPIKFHLEARRVGVVVDYDRRPRYFEVAEPLTTDDLEILWGIGRVVPGRFAFCAPLGRPAISTKQLAAILNPKPRRPIVGVARG